MDGMYHIHINFHNLLFVHNLRTNGNWSPSLKQIPSHQLQSTITMNEQYSQFEKLHLEQLSFESESLKQERLRRREY